MITYKNNLFIIEMEHSTYVFTGGDTPYNVYWGEKLYGEELGYLVRKKDHSSFDPDLNRHREEYGFWDSYNPLESCLKVNYPTTRQLDMKYQDHTIQAEGDREILTLRFQNSYTPLTAEVIYEVYPEFDIIGRSMRLTNEGETVVIENLKSGAVAIPPQDKYRVRYLSGRWTGESHINDQYLTNGAFTMQSRTGNTGPHFNPAFALDDGTATEKAGNVWFGLLGYSGNWQIIFERTTFQDVRVTGGISNFDFSYTLNKGESIRTPVMTVGFTGGGYGAMSRTLHAFENKYILPAKKTGRVLYNSWEATFFNVRVESQKELAKRAAGMGVELFVIDDGWFGQRHSDRAGLGDWYVNQEKFPNGLTELITYVKELGMDFGIWVEPESVNPDSDLYRNHPDWVYRFANREPMEARNQYTLNISKPEVKRFILDFMIKLLGDNRDITFVKWDMNKTLTDVSAGNTAADKELWYHHVQTLYEIWAELRSRFPHVEFETCSGGGSRVDLGILRYADQCWPSDNTDAYSRLFIQEGFSYFYAPRIMTSWVTDASTGDGKKYERPYSYRFHSSMMGMLGIGANISRFSEEALAEFAEHIAQYKEIRETVQYGIQYRLSSIRECPLHAVEYVSGDGKDIVVFAFHQGYCH
ncbi:MAG: alpha-galactosidase, partial [Lachnospiraceae bacterium]|nr:alpha-galactosidase [Lachnospiraceae bacterium]